MAFPSPNLLRNPLPTLLLFPAFFTSIWLWLYAGAGFLLKAARRLDIGFDWFSRRFDIEEKPLQSIGLVSGILVAVLYWTAVIVSRVVGWRTRTCLDRPTKEIANEVQRIGGFVPKTCWIAHVKSEFGLSGTEPNRRKEREVPVPTGKAPGHRGSHTPVGNDLTSAGRLRSS